MFLIFLKKGFELPTTHAELSLVVYGAVLRPLFPRPELNDHSLDSRGALLSVVWIVCLLIQR